ncbi:MAG TPA: hypothetical protein VI520_02940 [Anaerolineales bacterium]|nr:hypothetical protein [Anaerolineales bacterium]
MEQTLDSLKVLNRRYEYTAWGFLLIWWGLVEWFGFLPEGAGPIGTGVILLGLNAVRSLNGIRTNRFSMTVGILALVLGGLQLAGSRLGLALVIPLFPILLIVLGVSLLLPRQS